MRTRVYAGYTDGLKNQDLFHGLLQTVPKERQDKIDRFIFPRDKRLALVAGILLNVGLTGVGVDIQQVQYEYAKEAAFKWMIESSNDVCVYYCFCQLYLQSCV